MKNETEPNNIPPPVVYFLFISLFLLPISTILLRAHPNVWYLVPHIQRISNAYYADKHSSQCCWYKARGEKNEEVALLFVCIIRNTS